MLRKARQIGETAFLWSLAQVCQDLPNLVKYDLEISKIFQFRGPIYREREVVWQNEGKSTRGIHFSSTSPKDYVNGYKRVQIHCKYATFVKISLQKSFLKELKGVKSQMFITLKKK